MRKRSLFNCRLDDIPKYNASMESKENHRRLQEAVKEWRRNNDHKNCSTTDNQRTTNSHVEATIPAVFRKKNRNSCFFLSKNKTFFRPLSKGDKCVAMETDAPMRKCYSDVFLTETKFEAPGHLSDDHRGITISDLFQEASILAKKGPSKTTSLANMLRSLSPIFRTESKHYTTPNQSPVNFPRVVQPALTVLLASNKHIESQLSQKQSSNEIPISELNVVESERTKKPGALISENPPTSRNNFSRVDVMSTITEMSSRTSSRHLPPDTNSNVSLESPVSTRSEWKLEAIATSPTADVLRGCPNQGKYTHGLSMAKCYLCERYGYQDQIIFCTDGMRWNTPVPKESNFHENGIPAEPNLHETGNEKRSTRSDLGLRPPSAFDPQYSPYARHFSRHAKSFDRPYRFLKPLDVQTTPSISRSCSRSKWQSSDKMRLEYSVKRNVDNFKRQSGNLVDGNKSSVLYNSPYNPHGSLSVLHKLNDIYNGNGFVGRNRKRLPPLKRCPVTDKNLPTVETVVKQKLTHTQKKNTGNKPNNRKLNPMKTIPKGKCEDTLQITKNGVIINIQIPRCLSTARSPAYSR